MLGHLIYSYNHLDDARIQQEISKKLYSPTFGGVHLVHAHNGKRSFGYKPYLEDKLIRLKNRGHFQGACDLINAGMVYLHTKGPKKIKYALVTAADTWCLNVKFLKGLITEMERNNQVIAAASWSKTKYPIRIQGLSIDFFIVDIRWAKKAKIFPLHFQAFKNKFNDFLALIWKMPNLELTFQYQYNCYFMKNFKDNDIWRNRDKMIRRIREREPVHTQKGRTPDWPKIGLYTSPKPNTKQRVLKKLKLNLGPYSRKLIQAKNLNYYNYIK